MKPEEKQAKQRKRKKSKKNNGEPNSHLQYLWDWSIIRGE